MVSFRCSGVSLSFAITDPHPCVFVPHPCGPVSFSCLSKRKKPKRRTPPQHRLPRFLRGRCVNVGRGSPTMHPASRRTRARPARAPAGLVVRRPPALKGTRRATSSALLRAEPEPRCRSGVSRDRHTTTMLESIAAEAAPTRSSPPPLWEQLSSPSHRHFPFDLVAHHGVESDEQDTHAGGNGDFGALAQLP